MRLQSVTLRNYRLHRELTLSIDPARTVIGGPNEAGKSTVVEAIHRALFLKAKGNTESHRAMTSSLHPGHPEVELTFEAEGSVYVLKKRFGTSGTAMLSSAKSGRLSGDAAETELAKLLGLDAPASGKAALAQWGHLWIWQGTAGEDPSAHATQQRDGLLQRLQTMGGAGALQSECDTRVANHFAEAVSAIFTQAGKAKAGSELDRAESAAASAAEDLANARARVERLNSAATDLEKATRALATATTALEDLARERETTEAKAQELAALRQRETEQTHAAAEAATRLAELESATRQIEKTRDSISELTRNLGPLDETIARLESAQTTAQEKATAAAQRLQQAGEATRTARLHHEWARAWVELFEKREAHQKLAERFSKITDARNQLRDLEAQLAKLPAVDKGKLRKLQELEVVRSNAEAALQAMATGIEIISARASITANGQNFATGARQVFTEETEIAIGDVANLRIQPGGGTGLAEARLQEANARKSLQQSLDAAGLKSVAEAAEVLAQRDDLSSRIRAAQAELTGLGAAKIDEEKSQAANEVSAAEANVARRATLVPKATPPGERSAALAAAKRSELSLRENEDAEKEAKTQADVASAHFEAAQVTLASKRQETQQQRDSLTGLKAQLDLLLRSHGDDDARSRQLRQRQSANAEAEQVLHATRAAIAGLQPDLLPADARRIARAIEVRTGERNDARTQIAVAQAALRSDGHEDPPAALAAALAKARSATEYADAARRKAQALALLDRLFREEQRTLAGLFTQPLADRVTGYLQCIFGAGATAQVQLENHEFTGLRLARANHPGEAFAFDTLSGGTREQTAAAVRLAMAELLAADHDGCLPIVFDDAFAHSDPQRVHQLQRMLDLAATRGLQVIVLTCNPADYSALGAVEITLGRPSSPAS